MANLPCVRVRKTTEKELMMASGAWVRHLAIKLPSTRSETQTLFSWTEWEERGIYLHSKPSAPDIKQSMKLRAREGMQMMKGMWNWLEPLVWASEPFLVISVVGKMYSIWLLDTTLNVLWGPPVVLHQSVPWSEAQALMGWWCAV